MNEEIIDRIKLLIVFDLMFIVLLIGIKIFLEG